MRKYGIRGLCIFLVLREKPPGLLSLESLGTFFLLFMPSEKSWLSAGTRRLETNKELQNLHIIQY